jgi:hypothetical protein
MARRVRDIHAGAEHGHGAPARLERRRVRRAVDASASPLTTLMPDSAQADASARATRRPVLEAVRVPTMATLRTAASPGVPRIQSTGGASAQIVHRARVPAVSHWHALGAAGGATRQRAIGPRLRVVHERSLTLLQRRSGRAGVVHTPRVLGRTDARQQRERQRITNRGGGPHACRGSASRALSHGRNASGRAGTDSSSALRSRSNWRHHASSSVSSPMRPGALMAKHPKAPSALISGT